MSGECLSCSLLCFGASLVQKRCSLLSTQKGGPYETALKTKSLYPSTGKANPNVAKPSNAFLADYGVEFQRRKLHQAQLRAPVAGSELGTGGGAPRKSARAPSWRKANGNRATVSFCIGKPFWKLTSGCPISILRGT